MLIIVSLGIYFESIFTNFFVSYRVSRDLYPRMDLTEKTETIRGELNDSRVVLSELILMLERRSVERHYETSLRGVCEGGLLGLSLMTVATLATAFLLTLLVYVDSHTWIYLTRRRKSVDKSESQPFLHSVNSTVSPTIAATHNGNTGGTSTINRTLLHHHSNMNGVNLTTTRNGTTGALRGLAYNGGDSPPPDYNIVVHDNTTSRHD